MKKTNLSTSKNVKKQNASSTTNEENSKAIKNPKGKPTGRPQ